MSAEEVDAFKCQAKERRRREKYKEKMIFKQGFYILVPDEGPRSQLPTINRE